MWKMAAIQIAFLCFASLGFPIVAISEAMSDDNRDFYSEATVFDQALGAGTVILWLICVLMTIAIAPIISRPGTMVIAMMIPIAAMLILAALIAPPAGNVVDGVGWFGSTLGLGWLSGGLNQFLVFPYRQQVAAKRKFTTMRLFVITTICAAAFACIVAVAGQIRII